MADLASCAGYLAGKELIEGLREECFGGLPGWMESRYLRLAGVSVFRGSCDEIQVRVAAERPIFGRKICKKALEREALVSRISPMS